MLLAIITFARVRVAVSPLVSRKLFIDASRSGAATRPGVFQRQW